MSSFRILALSGSLRAKSSNKSLLQAMIALAPANVSITLFDGLGELPYFNPDLDTETDLPPTAREFRTLIGQMDAVVICSPEYAHGIPGVLKNALDWLVGSLEFPNKAVALINASAHSNHAHAALIEVLSTMSARIISDASPRIPVVKTRSDETSLLADPAVTNQLSMVIEKLVEAQQQITN
jgi:chromate reductase, NAD(P)H dehydrogenase (quinone)